MIRALMILAAAATSVAWSAGAAAQDFRFDPRQCSADRPDQCLNGVSASVTSLDSLRVVGTEVSNLKREDEDDDESKPVKVASNGDLSGILAENGSGWGIWGSLSRSDFESDIFVAPYEAKLNNYLFGVDRLVNDRLSLGVAFGYEDLDTDTIFNGGGQNTDGYTIAPYLAYLIDDVWSFDVSVGYSSLETDQNRIDPASTPGSPLILRASFDSDRSFATANLNAVQVRGNWVFGGRVGLLYSEEDQDGYTEVGGPSVRTVLDRNVSLTQALIGGDIARGVGDWEFYGAAAYRRDLSREDGSGAGGLPNAVGSTQPDDRDEFELGLGVRYFGRTGLTGNFEWLRTTGREDFENDVFTLVIRYDY